MSSGMPEKQGLYDPRHEHDSCGVGFVVDLKGRKSHRMVRDGLVSISATKDVSLTTRGRRAAAAVVRSHRCSL